MKQCPTCSATYPDHLQFCGLDAAPLHPYEPVDPLLGIVIEDRYRLDAVIGTGGFGTVYRAAHQRLPRDFAVKVLQASRAAEPRQVARFRQEVRAAAVLQHPNVCEVIDFGHDPQVGHFVVMPLLTGETLLDRLNRNRALPIVDTHPILLQMAGALGAAHDQGIVHRDIKVENIYLARDDSTTLGYAVKLLDFGIAKVLRPESDLRLVGEDRSPSEALQVLGSPLTMSPEQVRGQAIDGRSDLYSLGVVLFEMVAGELPFTDAKPAEIMRKHLQQKAPVPSSTELGAWIPPQLDDLVAALLAKDPADRPQTVRALLDRWEAVRPAVEEAWAHHHLIDTAARRSPRAPIGNTRNPSREAGASASARLATQPKPSIPSRNLVSDWCSSGILPANPARGSRSDVQVIAALRHDSNRVMARPTLGTAMPTPTFGLQPGDPPRVLVVDDDAAIRNLLRVILQGRGWACTAVDGGPAALVWLAMNPHPVAVVLDMLMPGMDGVAALRGMREAGFAGPVLFCSTLEATPLREEAEQLGAAAFVSKGMELYKLSEILGALGVPSPRQTP